MRHAWLIIAHNEFDVLQRLIAMLDAPESDFFIHFDKKVKTLPGLKAEKGCLTILDDRIDVRWGTVSQIKTELTLLETAAKNAPYSYYHIISGTTLPLRSLSEIDSFFGSMHKKSVVAGMIRDSEYQETLKLHRYNLFLSHYSVQNIFLRKVSQFLWRMSIAIQRMLGIRINAERTFYKASNWLSLTQEAATLILSRKEDILKTYRWSFCGDEFFVPSEIMNSSLRDKIYDCDRYLLHTIGRANACSYALSEWEELSKTDFLFARKFTR